MFIPLLFRSLPYRLAEWLLSVLAGLTLGPLMMYGAYSFLADIPDRSEMITVNTADIMAVENGQFNRKGHAIAQMCFITRQWGCVLVTADTVGFKDLELAVEQRRKYAIGFVRERELFSNSSRRYNMVYAVDIDGRNIKSFDDHVVTLKMLGITVFGLGLTALGFAIRALRKHLRNESA